MFSLDFEVNVLSVKKNMLICNNLLEQSKWKFLANA